METVKRFESQKVFDGYSACFRQWKAEGTHCKFLHGYAVSFKLGFRFWWNEKSEKQNKRYVAS